MHSNIIVLYPDSVPAAPGAPRTDALYRTKRRCCRLIAAVETIATILIGAGFLVCIALTITML